MKQQTLQEKQAESDRLYRRYRAAKKEQWAELCTEEPRLAGFRLALRRTLDARELLSRLADSWLRTAPDDIRFAALQQIGRHADRMARHSGREALDDPMPPALNVPLAAKELLAVR